MPKLDWPLVSFGCVFMFRVTDVRQKHNNHQCNRESRCLDGITVAIETGRPVFVCARLLSQFFRSIETSSTPLLRKVTVTHLKEASISNDRCLFADCAESLDCGA